MPCKQPCTDLLQQTTFLVLSQLRRVHAGIIYVSDSELGWEPPVKSWLAKREQSLVAGLQACFDKYVEHMLEYVRINMHPVMYDEAACIVSTLLTLLTATLKK